MESAYVMDRHRRVLGILHVAFGTLWVLAGVGALLVFAFGALSEQAPRERTAVVTVGSLLSGVLFLLAVPSFLAGFGMLKRRAWSKVPAMLIGLLSLLNFPVGTALGIYTLWFWFQPNAARLFFPQTPPTRDSEVGGPGLPRRLVT